MKGKPPLYFWIASFFTVVCLGGAAYYIRHKWDLVFANMQPSEWGEFLAGCSALLAFIWAVMAALFQLRGLLDEAMKSNRESADANLEHLQKLFGMEVVTLAHACENCNLHGPNGDSALLSDFVGTRQQCAEYADGKEYSRLIRDVEVGLKKFVENMNHDWSIDATEKALDDLAVGIGIIKGTCERIDTADDGRDRVGDWPDSEKLAAFKTQIESALVCVKAIQKVYSQFNSL